MIVRCAAGAWADERFPATRQTGAQSLPPLAYEYAEWKRCRVGLDYHLEIAKHSYSVPHQLLRQEVEARITVATIEIFHRGKRAASHCRSLRPHRPTTVPEHMPSSTGAIATGPTSASAMRPKPSAPTRRSGWCHPALAPHPEQGFRSCVGILELVKRYGAERVDAACARALVLGTRSYTSVAAILNNRRERAPAGPAEPALLIHENIRGDIGPVSRLCWLRSGTSGSNPIFSSGESPTAAILLRRLEITETFLVVVIVVRIAREPSATAASMLPRRGWTTGRARPSTSPDWRSGSG
jgi:hypothetical protein